ncbi:MAG: hypothetical protein AB8B82_16430 [Roseovarius sp.]
MTAVPKPDPVVIELEHVLDRGDLPPPYDRWGARLLAHLTKPVQVVVTGYAGSGKSALIEMLSAQPHIGRTLNLPMIELTYGPRERALIERADGSVLSTMGLLRDAECPSDAVRARQEVPAPQMTQQDYIEIGLSGSFDQKRATLQAAAARADVMIWCSQSFDEEERTLWAHVPDTVKDHSVLALTMADQQLMRGVLTDRIAELEPVVAEDFLGLFPVATLQGITARVHSDAVNDTLWISSGGQHLSDLLTRQVRQGRKADVDQARIFMDRLASRGLGAQDLVAVPETAPETAPTLAVAPDQMQDAVLDDGVAHAFAQAADVLQGHAQNLFDQIESAGTFEPDHILEGCAQAMTAVTDVLDANDLADAMMGAVRDDVQESEEMLMLFQLEQGEEAALDAVTLLLQVRKELIDKMAV